MQSIYIEHAEVITSGQRQPDGAVLIAGERILAAGPAGEIPPPAEAHREVRRLDASGLILAPGFIDIQINGAFGCDFTTQPSSIWEAAEQLPRYGITAFLPTLITSPLEQVAAARQILHQGPPPGFTGAVPLGLHVEGPFLNPARRGAHNSAYMRPPLVEDVEGWSPEAGVRLVTLAPELPGALEVIRTLADRGVVVSAGHSQASVEEAQRAFEAGITCGTHLFNAMPPIEQRKPGLAGALLAYSPAPGGHEVLCGMICDGVHLHPATVSLAWKALGAQRTILVTDAIAALGMPAGRYHLGDQEVIIDEVSSRLADGGLAGSILSTDKAIRNLLAITGCSLEEALQTVTYNPARLLGLENLGRGQILPGALADLVLLTPDYHVVATMVQGRFAFMGEGLNWAT